MRVCGECGKNLEGSATRCHFCGSTKVSYVSDPETPTPVTLPVHAQPAEKDGGITIIFDKGHNHPVEEEPAEEAAAEAPADEEEEPSFFSTAVQWARQPLHAALLGAALVAAGGILWWTLAPHRTQVEEVEADPRAVDPVLAKEFAKMVDAAIPEKLEWGRDILRRRVPSRFPEELFMEVDRDKPEIRYTSDEKSEAYYRFAIAYHYKEANKKLFVWNSVQFFFELRSGKWVLTGDRWPREWEVLFE
jgi:hypothetical protein